MNTIIDSQWISVPTTGGNFDAFLALPPGLKPGNTAPGLVLYQEIFGVNEHIRAVAEQYALCGFVVLAPDVFWRQSPRIELGYEGDDRQQGVALAGQLKPEQVMLDLRASVAALRALPQTQGRKLGAMGYCMGGRLAYMTAALAEIDCAVAYYGGGIHEQLHLASGINCAIQFHYAERDDHISAAAVDSVRAAFVGKAAEVFVYPGAMHGFNCWARASYDAQSAALAHSRALAFLVGEIF